MAHEVIPVDRDARTEGHEEVVPSLVTLDQEHGRCKDVAGYEYGRQRRQSEISPGMDRTCCRLWAAAYEAASWGGREILREIHRT